MSGPPYPRPGGAGSNGIGIGAIGIMSIGNITPFDPWATVMAQYANSPVLTGFINSFNAAMDQTENIENLYDMIWNIATAVGYGLDVWGRIVGVQRAISIPGSVSFFGFNEAGAGAWTGFGQGGFASPGSGLTTNYILSDSDFRLLILAKAAGNISDGGIPSVNAILLALFPGRGACYVVDGLNMSLTYTFAFGLTPPELAIVSQISVLPSAAGVVVNVAQI